LPGDNVNNSISEPAAAAAAAADAATSTAAAAAANRNTNLIHVLGDDNPAGCIRY
jgi:hypothetical protein